MIISPADNNVTFSYTTPTLEPTSSEKKDHYKNLLNTYISRAEVIKKKKGKGICQLTLSLLNGARLSAK